MANNTQARWYIFWYAICNIINLRKYRRLLIIIIIRKWFINLNPSKINKSLKSCNNYLIRLIDGFLHQLWGREFKSPQ